MKPENNTATAETVQTGSDQAVAPSTPCSAWAISSDGENYGHLDFPTKEDAVAEGQELYRGESFYVGELEHPTQPEDWFEADDWLEHVSCQDEYGGDHAEGWDSSTKEQRDELTAEVRKVMAAWLDHHNLRPTFWSVTNAERIEPNASSAETRQGN